jgi:hypothetical protein
MSQISHYWWNTVFLIKYSNTEQFLLTFFEAYVERLTKLANTRVLPVWIKVAVNCWLSQTWAHRAAECRFRIQQKAPAKTALLHWLPWSNSFVGKEQPTNHRTATPQQARAKSVRHAVHETNPVGIIHVKMAPILDWYSSRNLERWLVDTKISGAGIITPKSRIDWDSFLSQHTGSNTVTRSKNYLHFSLPKLAEI